MNALAPWPDHLHTDFCGAAVRLTTVKQNRQQHLLFGCIEMYPHEVPLPPSSHSLLKRNVGDITVVSTLTMMPVAESLAWYESALEGYVNVPGIPASVRVNTQPLMPEPRLGRLVLAKELPFECRWHCRPRIHHLVPAQSAPSELEWLTPSAENAERTKVRESLTDAVGFDLLAYDEFLFSLVVLVPNPILRAWAASIQGRFQDGGERIQVRAIPRRGYTLEDIRIRFREERPEGLCVVEERSFDHLGHCHIDLPESCGRAGIEIISGRCGILGADEPERFFRGVTVDAEVMKQSGSINVPARRKNEADDTYPLHARDRSAALRRRARPDTAEFRLIELQSRRETRSGRARPGGLWHEPWLEEIIFNDNRDEAVRFIRGQIGRAVDRIILVDPYFNHIDLREFALATQYVEVDVQILIDRNPLFAPVDRSNPSAPWVGDVLAADLISLAESLPPSGHRVPSIFLMGSPARFYHDRFLVVDDSVWHLGHSFNQVGEAAVSLGMRMRHPDAMREMILQDVSRAQSFPHTWPTLKGQRGLRAKTLWERVCRRLGRVWAALRGA